MLDASLEDAVQEGRDVCGKETASDNIVGIQQTFAECMN